MAYCAYGVHKTHGISKNSEQKCRMVSNPTFDITRPEGKNTEREFQEIYDSSIVSAFFFSICIDFHKVNTF